MASMGSSSSAPRFNLSLAALRDLWPLLVGYGLLLLPSLYELLTGIWATEDQAHGPIILALALWLIVRQWPEFQAASRSGRVVGGWVLFLVSLLLYVAGRSQQILSFEIGSLIGMAFGMLWIMGGAGAAKTLWFPFFFLLFLVPLPSAVVSMLTMPMKMAVSYATESLLFALGYPIARSGVILQIGQYQLLVADACAGLQTLLTLESLGLLYLNVVRRNSLFRNTTLALLIIPISFVANVTRVVALTLITYYFGDEAGQGFLHGFAGMVLFVSALVLIVSIDSLLHYIDARRAGRAAKE